MAALTASGLRSVAVDEAITALRALVEHRDDMVKSRTQTVNRLHVLTQLLPAGASRNLSADHAAQLLRTARPRSTGPRTLRRLAAELVGEIRHLDRRIATTTSEISAAVTATGSTLTELRGVGDLTAGKILARVGDITRFRSCGVRVLHRPRSHRGLLRATSCATGSPGPGDRQLNSCLHIMAITQIQRDTPGRAYYLRKRAAGKGHKKRGHASRRRPPPH